MTGALEDEKFVRTLGNFHQGWYSYESLYAHGTDRLFDPLNDRGLLSQPAAHRDPHELLQAPLRDRLRQRPHERSPLPRRGPRPGSRGPRGPPERPRRARLSLEREDPALARVCLPAPRESLPASRVRSSW